jgi:hypothetical protein
MGGEMNISDFRFQILWKPNKVKSVNTNPQSIIYPVLTLSCNLFNIFINDNLTTRKYECIFC